jgi:hypothetical protein
MQSSIITETITPLLVLVAFMGLATWKGQKGRKTYMAKKSMFD